ncbi:MAG: glycine--tRNA ligase subunit beta [Sandaracinus sp.]|nr:glycine--tRNA ligase subunit beta [Sandaracinus sp.]
MPDLLLELGLEELPASFVRSGLASLAAAAKELFAANRLDAVSIETLGTPRRLTVFVHELPAAQPDREEVVQGPPWNVAFKDGAWTKAAEGFAKKNGLSMDALFEATSDDPKKPSYVAAKVFEKGRATAEVLAELLPELCRRTSFPKSMRWGQGDFAFGRPVQWLVALLDDEVVPFEFAGITSDRKTRGHRFLAPAFFEVPSASAYEDALEGRHVIARIERRQALMEQSLSLAASGLGGTLVPDDFLVSECAMLVEKPFVVPGSFEPHFLELPEAVIVSVMRDHQRYFAVKGPDGKLLPAYLNVVGTANDPERIAKGNDRVLRARLADARFFVTEDRKQKLADRRKKLDAVTFQHKLGSIGAKVERIEKVATHLAKAQGLPTELLGRAATLAKCDLESLIVFEFPELQGQMGRFYAEKDGEDPAVCLAIEEHWRPAGASDEVPTGELGALLAVADRLDTLVGCFAIGQQPKGNADPFGLRRAALGVIRIALEGPIDVPIASAVDAALDALSHLEFDAAAVRAEVLAFVSARLDAQFRGEYGADLVDAVLGAWQLGSLRDFRARLEALAAFRQAPEYEPLAVAFKRAFNIAAQAGGDVDPALLEAGAEKDLFDAFEKARGPIDAHTAKGEYAAALAQVATELKAPIDRYFDDVFVMVDDERVRGNRLALLKQIADTVSRIVHFHKL